MPSINTRRSGEQAVVLNIQRCQRFPSVVGRCILSELILVFRQGPISPVFELSILAGKGDIGCSKAKGVLNIAILPLIRYGLANTMMALTIPL